ncbi:MAG: serine protease [Syntrophaceae bacterium]|jgi:S1-C subfamily serine protease|nr:serine protease [Syntrophaceae bacterium]
MKRLGTWIFVMTWLAAISPAYAQEGVKENVKELLKAVVKVRAAVPDYARSARTLGTEREGSGVLIDMQGHILTIGYLILEAESVEVVGPDGKAVGAQSIAYDHITGFGVLKVDKPLEAKPMQLGQSSEVKEGDPILVATHGGEEGAMGARIVSRKEFAGYWEYLLDDAIFTAPPHANFGGAALIDHNGKLVGIGSLFTQIAIAGLGMIPGNMFVPIDYLKPILSEMITKGRSPEPPRPWLGLNAEEAHGRVFVTRVVSEGPAEKAGLKVGDILLAVNKKEISGLADFYRKVWALGKPGVEVTLTLLQGIQIQDIKVKSGDRYQYYPLKAQKKI